MKPLVYVETSVISYLAARPSKELISAARQSITHDWWDSNRFSYDICISALVEEEISEGNSEAVERRLSLVVTLPSAAISDIAISLAEKLIAGAAIPAGSEEDALHIGIAAAHAADYLLTWNFKHINNAEMKSKIIKIIEKEGFVCPQICSPEELGGLGND